MPQKSPQTLCGLGNEFTMYNALQKFVAALVSGTPTRYVDSMSV